MFSNTISVAKDLLIKQMIPNSTSIKTNMGISVPDSQGSI
jgi:hypothetical protein